MKILASLMLCILAIAAPVEGITPIATDKAPKAIGPYSQAIVAGSNMYISGQIALDPISGKLKGNTIEEQVAQVLQNLKMILQAQGLTFEHVVKADVFLKDLNDFKAMNSLYAEAFSGSIKPARVTTQAAKLPMDALVEIALIAYISE